MGLVVSVYKNPLGDCTNNGISSRATDLLLVNVSGPTDNNSPRYQKALLVPGNGKGLVKIVPAAWWPNLKAWSKVEGWCMMGGNYASTSDSRFHDAVCEITGGASYGAVPIHDRIE
jgi:hypothetical protein